MMLSEEYMHQTARASSSLATRLMMIGLFAFALSMIAEFFVTISFATQPVEVGDYIGVAIYFALFATGGIVGAIRARRGRGQIIASVTLAIFALAVFLAVVIVLAIGGHYIAPRIVYVTHAFTLVAYLFACVTTGYCLWRMVRYCPSQRHGAA
jgi:hypothetical protein